MSDDQVAKKTLHSKRSFGKYPRGVDSPAYDASEEDNETDDSASISSIPSFTRPARAIHTKIASRRHPLASEDEGVDSPTYDGDIESSTTARGSQSMDSSLGHHHHTLSSASSTSTLNTPTEETGARDTAQPVFISQPHVIPPTPEDTEADEAHGGLAVPASVSPNVAAIPLPMPQEPAPVAVSRDAFNPAALTPQDIRAFAQRAIQGESFRNYKINNPPTDRPVRIYADGVYDLFHFGHALALRQAKLSFPNVYLLVGVCSDELVLSHKAQTVMTHAERCEAVRHCRWVDEIVQEAPWILDQEFLDKREIDYIAHDEDPYAGAGHDDVYQFVKDQGKFLPTRRTPGVSTSELLERIVSGYRNRDFDAKLVKMGHAELKAEGSDYEDRSRAPSRTTSRSISPVPMRLGVPSP